MAEGGLAPQTIKLYLAAVRNAQLSLGLPDPRDKSSLPILKRVQAGISRARLGRGQPSRIRLPVTAKLLRQIRSALEYNDHPEKRLIWAVCCTAFFGFFCLGELLLASGTEFDKTRHLAWGDMAVDSQCDPRVVRFHVKQSKTDQFGRGADIILGRTGLDLCPVIAVLGYVASRGAHHGPFFITSSRKPLLKARFVEFIRETLDSIGFPHQEYTGHSFRIGAATTAALAGVEDSTIQLLGRWQSAAFLRYIRTPPERLASLSRTLAAQGQNDSTPAPQRS